MRRRAVEIVVVLLHVFAVIAFAAGQPEKALFEDGIASVPQGDGKADLLLAVADAGEPVLVPSVGARARMVVRKVVPGFALRAVVLAHGAPGALAQVRAPLLPVDD